MTGPLRWLGIDGEFTVRPYRDERSRLPGPVRDNKLVSILDIETLGLEPSAPVIEIAIQQVEYEPTTGDLFGITDEYASLQDPGVPIPDEITKLTGITDADVRGQKINVERVAGILNGSSLCVAHNAKFDRPRVDALLAAPSNVCWACSSEMLDWRAYGLPSASLGALCMCHGFYVDAHRAMADVAGLTRLLGTTNAETGRTYFADLLVEARRPVVEVFALNSPFSVKDALKEREYRWHPERKVWSKVVYADDGNSECAWLAANAQCQTRVDRIDPRRRFA